MAAVQQRQTLTPTLFLSPSQYASAAGGCQGRRRDLSATSMSTFVQCAIWC